MLIYIIVGCVLVATGLFLSNYELKRTKRARVEQLRQRARRCVRGR